MADNNQATRIKILRRPQVEAMTGLARSTLYHKMANQAFPANIKLGRGARAVGWTEESIQAWIHEQQLNSRKEAA